MTARATDRWLGLGLLFCVAIVLATLRGAKTFQPSQNNHFAYLAQSWLNGTTHLPGEPPGYCSASQRKSGQCKNSNANDWGKLEILEFNDGTQLRGFPCYASTCRPEQRTEVAYWIVGEGWRSFQRKTIARTSTIWYVTFPPAPALVMLPLVAVFGVDTPDILVTILAHALGVCLVFWTLRRLQIARSDALWLSCAWAFASPATEMAAQGSVWFTGHIFGTLGLSVLLWAGIDMRRPGLAGIGWALALGSRPINALPFFLILAYESMRARIRLRYWLAWLGTPTLALVAMAWLNWLRFGDIFEFGHRFLETRWQPRIQSIGLFSPSYLPRNLECLAWLMPQWTANFPYLTVSIHGIALWLSTPWIVVWRRPWAFESRQKVLLLCAIAAALPSLFYQNSGQLQFSYRFAADWLLLVLVATGLSSNAAKTLFRALVVCSAVLHLGAAYLWMHAPGVLFHAQPLGWPFEAELLP